MSEFLSMGGYAFYVWTSFGLTFIVMALVVLYSMLSRRRAVALVKRQSQVNKVQQVKK